MLLVWAFALYGILRSKNGSHLIGAALLVSWFGARITTNTENELVFVAGMTVAFLLSYKSNSVEGYAIAFLYGIRILLAFGFSVELYDLSVLWNLNRVFFYLQLIIVFGSFMPENGKRVVLKHLRLTP